jgi:hypothetical protein
MSTNDPEFYQAPKFTPEPPQVLPKQRGCFFYGCIIASILAVLFVILMGVMAFLTYRFVNKAVEDYTSTKPQPLPTVEMPVEKRQALNERVEAFKKAVEAGTPTEPLVLTSDDLNALLDENEEFKGKFFVKVDGDAIKGEVSIPLDPLARGPFRATFQGRYLNGKADFKASLQNGVLLVTLDSIEVNGKKPPDELLTQLRQENLAKDAYKNPKNAEMIRKLESLEVKDGKIILKVRAKGGTSGDTTTTKKDVPIEVVAPPSDAATKAEAPAKAEPPKAEDSPKTKAQPPAVESAAPKP